MERLPTTPSPKQTTVNVSDSLPRESKLAAGGYRTSGLDAARKMIREDIDHVVLLHLDVLFQAPPAYGSDDITQHLLEQGQLPDGKRNPQRISKTELDLQSDL